MIKLSRSLIAIDIGLLYVAFIKWSIGNYFGCTNGWYFEYRFFGKRKQYKLTNRAEHFKVNQVR